ncbi:hypothetical protein SDC9_79574 [bioreactor metagenome]|uniref:Uncharacterized protein n=1 Tax=bioreactor metagenome TaxID=1076179 RepID=A0A644YXA3_9ZZZZ
MKIVKNKKENISVMIIKRTDKMVITFLLLFFFIGNEFGVTGEFETISF